MSTNKKRMYEEENRSFKSEWEEEFAFTDDNGKPQCIICDTTLTHYKASNLKCHYETNHASFLSQYPLKSDLRRKKLTALKSAKRSQQTVLSLFKKKANAVTEASFLISWNIAHAKRPYSDGEFIKKNISEVVATLDPKNSKLNRLITQIPVSHHATERRISQISADVEKKMQNDLQNCVAFSLALDESTDIQDTPQLVIFVRYVSADITVTEELLEIVALKETTHGTDIKDAFDRVLTNCRAPIKNLVSVAIDGAPAMIGKNVGLIGLMKSDPNIPEFLPVHCIIHHEHLIAKYFKYENVMKTTLQIVNFIHTNAKTHRQFKNFLEDLDLEDKPNDISFYCLIRWLSTSNVLKGFVELLGPIIAFLQEKGKSYPQLKDDIWLLDLMFLTDVMQHLQSLNLSLQGKNKIISDLTQTVFSFQQKIQLLQRDVISKTFNHFPHLKSKISTCPELENKNEKLEEYRDKLQGMTDDFSVRFDDLQKLKPCLDFLINPFMVDILNNGFPISKFLLSETSAGEMELLEMQEDSGLKMMHKSFQDATEFWKLVPETKYPQLKKVSCRLLSIFGTTYCCEALYSTMKFVKSKQHAILTDQHLKELLSTALTSYCPDFKKLATSLQSSTSSDN